MSTYIAEESALQVVFCVRSPTCDTSRRSARLSGSSWSVAEAIALADYPVRMNIGLRRALIAAGLACNGAAMLTGHLSPADGRGDAYSKTSRSRTATHASVCRRDNSIP